MKYKTSAIISGILIIPLVLTTLLMSIYCLLHLVGEQHLIPLTELLSSKWFSILVLVSFLSVAITVGWLLFIFHNKEALDNLQQKEINLENSIANYKKAKERYANALLINIDQSDIEHLNWIYNRLAYIHGEDKLYDYMQRFQKIINKLKKTLPAS